MVVQSNCSDLSATRRRFLKSALAGAVIAPVSGCTWLEHLLGMEQQLASIPSLDIHCHVFNAADLPVKGFVEEMYLGNIPSGIPQDTIDAFIALVSHVMEAGSISAADELKDLTVDSSLQPHRKAASSQDQKEAMVRAKATEGARQLIQTLPAGGGAGPNLRPEKFAPHAVGSDDFDQRKRKLLQHLAKHAKSFGSLAPQFALPYELPRPELVADGIIEIGGDVFGTFWMATLLTLHRSELVNRLAGLPNTNAGDLKFFAPAMVDYSYWVDDFSPTPLAEQIDVMSAIMAMKGRDYAVHGWVSFCPARQIAPRVGDGDQFELVKQAIQTRGFIGVKLYPVLGFYPAGNATTGRNDEYPKEVSAAGIDFRQKLDDALGQLYSWCEAEGVPILAHCSYSQYPTNIPGAGMRGAPAGWAAVLKQYPNLRLDIGHAGGLWHQPKSKDPNAYWELKPPPGKAWTPQVIDILNEPAYKFVSADLADYSEIINHTAEEGLEDADLLAQLKQMLGPSSQARTRLMYGTDWVMMSRALKADEYYPEMRNRFVSSIDGVGFSQSEIAGFLGGNAARLIGLSMVGNTMPQTRSRLEQFYKNKPLDPSILKAFDPPMTPV